MAQGRTERSGIAGCHAAARRLSHELAVTLIAEGRLIPLVTTALFLEYEDVLNRPEQRLATGVAKEDVLGFLAAMASAAEAVEVHFMWRPQLADPADELVLEAAVNGRASANLTQNTRDCLPAAHDFEIGDSTERHT